MTSSVQNEIVLVPEQRLGRLPVKSSRKALMFADFFKFVTLPSRTSYWLHKPPFPLRTFGNNAYGNCTRAKQAFAILRTERIEQRRTVEITDDEVIARYVDMSNRLYGGGDNGAYETDALDEWRRPETTIRDTQGHPYTIDAYLRIDPFNQDQLRAAIALSGAHGIAVCLNLPAAWQRVPQGEAWSIPDGQPLTGPWMPGSWGGHSMWCFEYNEVGPVLDMTWNMLPQQLTWQAAAAYLDEAHLVIDSIDAWRRKPASPVGTLAYTRIVHAVNDVSSYRIT